MKGGCSYKKRSHVLEANGFNSQCDKKISQAKTQFLNCNHQGYVRVRCII